ncbi:MAG: glycoside hydrolase family 38 C-terminal domain-containing protein [Gemmatimonadaceae bacterium]
MSDPSLDVFLVTHTHWDREWYHSAGRFRQRLAELLDGLLASSTPGLKSFLLDGQCVLIEDYLAVRPERRELLSNALRGGGLQAGPWYVLADELIPSGEALVRNLMAGREVMREMGAEPMPVLYSPDAFGHPATLPSIARGFGLPVAILWRGLGGEAWPSGDAFLWLAPDGSSVLVHHLPEAGYEYGANLPVDASAARRRWATLRAELGARASLRIVLVMNGADHHAPQGEFAEALAALRAAADEKGDRVIQATLGEFAAAILDRVSETNLPEIEGELRNSYGYTWSLQGTLGSRAHLKRRNALLERLLLREAEPWAALARLRSGKERNHLLRAAWKTLLLCHPHDTLCGCVTDEVARAMAARLDDAHSQALGICQDALVDIVDHDHTVARTRQDEWRSIILVRNPAAVPRGGIAILDVAITREHVPVGPGSAVAMVEDQVHSNWLLDGGDVPFQPLNRLLRHDRIESPEHYPHDDLVDVTRVAAWVDAVPAYGVRAVTIGSTQRGRPPSEFEHARAGDTWLDNGILRLDMRPGGTIELSARSTSMLVDSLLGFEDVDDAGDLYTPSLGSRLIRGTLQGSSVVHSGPLRAEIVTRWRLELPSSALDVVASLVLDAGANFLRVAVKGDNTANDHRLRIVFSTGISGGAIHADAAYGALRRRPVRASQAARRMEQPPATDPLARYVTVADDHHGVTLFSDGLAEYEATSNGDVAVTLVRSVGELSRNDIPERPGHAGWPVTTPEAQSSGLFEAEFAIMLHGPRADSVIAAVEHAADDVLLPITGDTLRSALAVPSTRTGASLKGNGLAFCALKESGDGEWIVARCVNLLETTVLGAWLFGSRVTEARLARLDESPLQPLAVRHGEIAFDAPPRGIVTILVR